MKNKSNILKISRLREFDDKSMSKEAIGKAMLAYDKLSSTRDNSTLSKSSDQDDINIE